MLAGVLRKILWKADGRVPVRVRRHDEVLNIQIGDDDVIIVDIVDRQRRRSVIDDPDLVTLMRKHFVQRLRQVVVVIDYQYSSLHQDACRQ